MGVFAHLPQARSDFPVKPPIFHTSVEEVKCVPEFFPEGRGPCLGTVLIHSQRKLLSRVLNSLQMRIIVQQGENGYLVAVGS